VTPVIVERTGEIVGAWRNGDSAIGEQLVARGTHNVETARRTGFDDQQHTMRHAPRGRDNSITFLWWDLAKDVPKNDQIEHASVLNRSTQFR
jgi:hypothetical protein